MKHRTTTALLLVALCLAGFAVGIGLSQDTITEIQRIGDLRPTGLKYDVNFHQFVWVNPQGQLEIADATTYQSRHVIYESGLYNSYIFSHDGRRLAIAIDTRVEIWDTQTGEKITEINPDGALRTEAPLFFSDDNLLLSFNTQVRAPRELRRSENDTVNLPWVWDFEATARIRTSILRNGVTAEPFFDLRNGFLFGPGNYFVTGFEGRLQLLRVDADAYPLIAEIPANRFEPDPIAIWFNQDHNMTYIRPSGSSNLQQVNAITGGLNEIPVSQSISLGNISDNFPTPALELENRQAFSKFIGEPTQTEPNTLLRRLLGDDYLAQRNYQPTSFMLLDVLQPQTAEAGNEGLLIYENSTNTSTGRLHFLQAQQRNQYLLHSDGNHLIYSHPSGRIEVFDIRTGGLVNTFQQATSERQDVFALDATGDILISDFQQFNIWTGEVLYQNFDFYVNVGEILFSPDNTQLITITGNNWWVWDIKSDEVIQQEVINFRGEFIGQTSDRHRYLTEVRDRDGLLGREIYDVRTGARRNVFFENLQDRTIQQIIVSPDWEHYLVIYSGTQYGPYQPGGNIISMYNMDEGKQWLIAGDDLPQPNNRGYGWVDNDTIYVYGERQGTTQPARIYGVDYHVSGLPQCMVDEFPNTYMRWLGLWERLATTQRSDTLHQLALSICDALPGDDEVIENVIFPSPTPTRAPVTPTPSAISGIPQCLTNRFPLQAQEYAEDWRRITEGLSDEQIEEQERLLCAGLTGSDSTSGSTSRQRDTNTQVMLIDIATGQRSLGGFIPPRETSLAPNVQLVINDLTLRGIGPFDNGIISPDGTLFAAKNRFGHVLVYRLPRKYQELSADATATESIFVQESAKGISLQPTPTQGFAYVGEPRPTLTPTITPTSPPRTEDIFNLARRDEVEELCPADHLYHISEPPPDYQASGRLFVQINQGQGLRQWVLEAATGRLYLDDTLPSIDQSGYSPDLNWIVTFDEAGLVVKRPDGSDRIVIYENRSGDYREPQNLRWIPDQPHRLAWNFQEWVSGERQQQRFYRELDPETGEIMAVEPPPRREIEFDGPAYNVVEIQPGTINRYAVLQTTFNTGRNIGSKYYIYDYETETSTYFARFADVNSSNSLEFQWDEFGDLLFYHYPTDELNEWYVFDTRTAEFSFYGDLKSGIWSRDDRYRISPYRLPEPEYRERVENEEALPKIQIWDSQTDLIRIYCVPQTGQAEIDNSFNWSPDNRYVVFRTTLPDDAQYPAAPTRTLILDTETGYVTEVSQEIASINLWTLGE